ncbi:hypothetical protein FRB96_005857 [Tulasnella sp. 330]|nr:hypothetical protein FRB96_005857 [Tulasnella sp. 330]KAG8889573.1 hypothetical protein FRB98_003842 [Tulasnella sp. 332]
MRCWTRAKATVPYVVGGTKITLGVLSTVASLISHPCVQTVIDAASQIITIVEGVNANRADTKALAGRLLGLLAVISETHKDKNENDLSPDVRSSLNRLKSQLDEILVEIREIRVSTDPHTFKGFCKGVLLYGDNGGKIREYTTRIGWAMNVEGRIGDSLRLLEVVEDSRHVRGVVDDMHVITQDVRVVVQETNQHLVAISGDIAKMTRAPTSPMDTLPSSSIIPSRPPILYGRDKEIKDIAHRIVTTESPRYTIHGPGGIGKTALSLGVMEHPDVTEKYGDSRHFIQCEQATSSALLIELIARGLSIEESSNDRMKDVMSRLRSTKQPILLILDNFETPWDIVGEKSRVESILCQTTSLPHVAILLTMRSDAPPSTHVQWSLPWLDPISTLAKDAAHALYVNVDPKADGDSSLDTLLAELSSLDTLLAELSYMPLAITLMASMGRSGPRPTALLQAWRDKAGGIDLFRGTDKNESVKISIQLSIESNRMKSVPEALTLLSLVAMLPAGANFELLPSLARNIPNFLLAQLTLSGTALAHVDSGKQVVQLLSPVRSYVLKHHPASDRTMHIIYDSYAQFVTRHNAPFGSTHFSRDARVLAAEETNLEAILPLSIRSGSCSAIEAAIDFSRYQRYTRPQLEIITCAVDVCRRNANFELLARSLAMLGEIFYCLNRYEESTAIYQQASDVYEGCDDRLGMANCLRGLGDIHRMQGRHAEAEAAFQQASGLCGEFGDRLGVANCQRGLGDMHRMRGWLTEAEAEYRQAFVVYEEFGDRFGMANCLRGLGDIHGMQGQHAEAEAAYQRASGVYRELGFRLGVANCLKGLGDIYRMQERHREAKAVFKRACVVYKELGSRLGVADCAQGFGHIYREQGRRAEAESEYQQASTVYEELGDRDAQQEYSRAKVIFQELGHKTLTDYDTDVTSFRLTTP